MRTDPPRTALVTARTFAAVRNDPRRLLEEAGLVIVSGSIDHELTELRPTLADTVAWIAGTAPITAAHLDAAPNLRIIARNGAGFDAVDLPAAEARGIVVTNAPGANSESVADHTIGLMLACIRQITLADSVARGGDAALRPGRELGELVVGLIGFGAIGRAVARRLHGFGSHVIAYDPHVPASKMVSAGATSVGDLSELAMSGDVLSLHRPGGGIVVDRELINHMRQGVVVVNTARADLVDDDALAAALIDGRVGGAAIDVARAASPLLRAPNVVITPHIAAHTAEAVERMSSMVTGEVLRVMSGKQPRHSVTTS